MRGEPYLLSLFFDGYGVRRSVAIVIEHRDNTSLFIYTMNLDKAFVLLFASLGAVAGFTPAFSTSSQRVASSYVPKQVAPIFSEVEEATTDEAPAAVEEPVAAAVEEPAADAPFDTAIYVGNVSFGELYYDVLMESYIIIIIHYTCMRIHCSTVKSRQLTVPLFCTDAVESDIRSAFAEHGTVQKVQMPLDRNTVSDCWKNMLFFLNILLHILLIFIFLMINCI